MKLLIVAAAALLAAPASADLTRIGAAGAVHGKVQAVAPNTVVGRIIDSGKDLYLNDHVTTDADGHLQVMLLDETVFTLGPDADMVLDEFVYDPKTDAGKVTARVVKGAFRFVTGKVARAHPQNMKVGLAVGTIGIRGTVVLGQTGPNGSTVINVGAGPENDADERPSAIIVENAGTARTVDTTGDGVTITPGQAPSFPTDMTAQIDKLSNVVELPPETQKPAQNDPFHGDATSASGEVVAVAKTYSMTSTQQQQQSSSYDQQSSNASQVQSQSDNFGGVSSWEQLIANLTGTGYYSSPSAVFYQYVQNGATLGTPITGTWGFNLTVDFSGHLIDGSTGITVTNGINDSGTFNNIPFGRSGPATLVQTSGSGGVYSFTFLNANGQIGGQVLGTASYSAGSGATLQQGAGVPTTATFSRSPGG